MHQGMQQKQQFSRGAGVLSVLSLLVYVHDYHSFTNREHLCFVNTMFRWHLSKLLSEHDKQLLIERSENTSCLAVACGGVA